MAKIRIKQVKSAIDMPSRQKRTLLALGIKKMHRVVEHEGTPQIMGLIGKVRHMLEIVK